MADRTQELYDELARWYIVTGRRNGDDEDDLLIVQAADARHATEKFRDHLRNVHQRDDLDFSGECHDDPRRLIYLNHIVECPPGEAPLHVAFPW